MSETDTDRDGVRPYLKARMPTFYFSPLELRKLVRFFQALSSQPLPYIPQEARAAERAVSSRWHAPVFTSRAAPCLKCHATGDPGHDRFCHGAQLSLLARDRLKPDWTKHWMLDPALISPGTAMPRACSRRTGRGMFFAGPVPPIFTGYGGDHAELLVRYMFEITPRRSSAG